MPRFYRGSKENVRPRIARVLLATSSYLIPTRIQDVISMTSYDPNTVYGFRDLGYTADPVVTSVMIEQEPFTNEFGVRKTVPVTSRHVIRTALAEQSTYNLRDLFGTPDQEQVEGGTVNEWRLNIANPRSLPSYRLAILELDDDNNKINGIVYPNAQISPTSMDEAFNRREAYRIPVEFNAYPNIDNYYDTNGEPVIRIDLTRDA